MGTEDEVATMLAQVDTDRQAHSSAGPSVSPAAGEDAAPPPAPDAVEFVKARETIRRPPLPSPGLYDAYLVRGPAPIPIRRQVETEAESHPAKGTPGNQSRQERSDVLMVSPAEALAAMEAWSTPSPRHKPKAGVS